MKSIVALALAGTLLGSGVEAAPSSTLTGSWQGAFSRNGSVQVVNVTFGVNGTGQLQASYSIPELTLYDEPVRNVALSGDQLSMKFLYGGFTAVVNPDGNEITGTNADWNPPIRVDLKRMVLPEAYGSHSVRVHNGPMTIAGTLYMPSRRSTVPLVVVIPGSNTDGRAQWEYRGYGPALATAGIACYVYDKRNVGESTRVAGRITFDDYASDVNAIVGNLRRYPGIDAARVGVLGLSQGGWIAAMASARNREIAFVALGAGPSRSVEQQELDRVEFTLRDRKAPAGDIAAALSYTTTMFDAAYGRIPASEYAPALALLKSNPPWADVVSGPDPGETAQDVLKDWQAQRYDPSRDLRALRVPVLAFFGTSDVMVPPERNVALMESDLQRAPAQKIVVIEGANHGLFAGQGVTEISPGWPGTYWRWDRRASGVIETIAKWAEDSGV